MKFRALLFALLALSLTAVGCGESETTNAPTASEQPEQTQEPSAEEMMPPDTQEQAITWHGNIKPLFEQNCMACHRDGGIAPFGYENFEDVKAQRMAIKSAVANRTMPPWHAADDCIDYKGSLRLGDDQVKMISDWVDSGAPEGDPSDAPEAIEENTAQGLTRVDKTIKPAQPYMPQLEPDDYHCFLIDWDEPDTTYLTGFAVSPDNVATVHHVILYLIPPEEVAYYEQLDENEPGPGYTCYGGPGGGGANVGFLSGWAPGNPGNNFPEGTGIQIRPGSKIAMQVHYNTLNGLGPDQTSVDLKLDAEVEKEAIIMPFTNPSWLSGDTMRIPPDDDDVMHRFGFDISTFVGRLSEGRIPNGAFDLYSASMHLHTLGKSAKVEIERGEGEDQCLLDIPQWDFNWQRPYGFAEPVRFNPGDRLNIECHWDNSPGNQNYIGEDTDGDGVVDKYTQREPELVSWGDGTADEMCVGFFYITAP